MYFQSIASLPISAREPSNAHGQESCYDILPCIRIHFMVVLNVPTVLYLLYTLLHTHATCLINTSGKEKKMNKTLKEQLETSTDQYHTLFNTLAFNNY